MLSVGTQHYQEEYESELWNPVQQWYLRSVIVQFVVVQCSAAIKEFARSDNVQETAFSRDKKFKETNIHIARCETDSNQERDRNDTSQKKMIQKHERMKW